MISLIIIFFVIYSVSLGLILMLGSRFQQKKEKSYFREKGGIDLEELTVLIPFRDEENRINVVLKSILASEFLPKKIIFIDDHSTDRSVELIQKSLKEIDYTLLSLPLELAGKKKALRFAIKDVKTNYILTQDADVSFDATYFESLSKLEKADMYVLPAILEAKNRVQYLYEIDVVLVNALNTGLAGLKRPVIASGANLLFKRSAFNEVDNLASHVAFASGDDTYLLRDFRDNNKDVRLISNQFCAVKTETPQSFKEFINQRLRWIGKTGNINDGLSTGLAIGQSILAFTFFALLIIASLSFEWKTVAVLFIIKSTLDLMLFASYFARISRRITWLFIPVYELLFPFYSLTILVLLMGFKPKWKGRGVVNR